MLFNSYVFIFAYLPVTLIVYFILNRFRFVFASNCWLALSSLFFYSWWNISYLPLMLGSILFNYIVSRLLQGVRAHSYSKRSQSIVLLIGISGNIGLLGYYKYADFFPNERFGPNRAGLAIIEAFTSTGDQFFYFHTNCLLGRYI
jgi:alginate O-acetyltransferase complex protein AlgI